MEQLDDSSWHRVSLNHSHLLRVHHAQFDPKGYNHFTPDPLFAFGLIEFDGEVIRTAPGPLWSDSDEHRYKNPGTIHLIATGEKLRKFIDRFTQSVLALETEKQVSGHCYKAGHGLFRIENASA